MTKNELFKEIQRKRSFLCIGLDTDVRKIPQFLQDEDDPIFAFNKRIIDATAERMGLPAEKVMLNIHKYGNTTSATIILALNDYEQQLKKGDNIVLAAFGGGFTWGAIYLKWAYDGAQVKK